MVHRGALWRIHQARFEPIFFGRTGLSRFDDPRCRFGVLYTGATLECAVVETLAWTTGRVVVTNDTLAARRLCQIWPNPHLRLVDLAGPGLTELGADGRLATGSHRLAQRWSRWLYGHPEAPDGLLYRSRHDPSQLAVAVYDRALNRLLSADQGGLLDPSNAPGVARALDRYGIGVVDDRS